MAKKQTNVRYNGVPAAAVAECLAIMGIIPHQSKRKVAVVIHAIGDSLFLQECYKRRQPASSKAKGKKKNERKVQQKALHRDGESRPKNADRVPAT